MGSNIYSEKNKLNNLTGSEWKFSTKSVINKVYPINMQHKLRSEHGGQKPPELCADLIKIFTKENQLVLDPFMGVGGTLLGASLVNRKAVGIDLNSRWIEIYKEKISEEYPIIDEKRVEKLAQENARYLISIFLSLIHI